MKRWAAGLIIVLLCCLPMLEAQKAWPGLFGDTDTVVILQGIDRQPPWHWFASDWPLGNHFYRPVSTLSFQLDRWLYGEHPTGYGVTNLLLVVGCVVALYWFLREVTDKVPLSVGGAALLALWVGLPPHLEIMRTLPVNVGLLALFGALIPGRNVLAGVGAMLIGFLLSFELPGMTDDLAFRLLGWIPGRTASCMCLFALVSLALYTRHLRRGVRQLGTPSAMDQPATRSSVAYLPPSGWERALPALSLTSFGAALLSYEQAVMLPFAFAGIGLYMRTKGYPVSRKLLAGFGVVMVAYLVARYSLVPAGVSGYQAQQMRHGGGIALTVVDSFFSATQATFQGYAALSIGADGLITTAPYLAVLALIANLYVLRVLFRQKHVALLGLATSFFTFLPMAWFNHFGHYFLLPMALRTLYVGGLFGLLVEHIVSAWSRPALQAPPRPSPAPGSLPRP